MTTDNQQMLNYKSIIDSMPYGEDFLFVDRYDYIREEGACGYYRFKPEAAFYASHFPDNPITPGVILIECMAQIGLVGLGIFLMQQKQNTSDNLAGIAFSESQVQFLKKVLPGEEVKVVSEKVYFRLGKLKCHINMYNEADERICYGTMSGVIISKNNNS